MCFEANAQGFKNAMDKVFAIIVNQDELLYSEDEACWYERQKIRNRLETYLNSAEHYVTELVEQLEENETFDVKILNEKYPTILQYYKNAKAMVAEIKEKVSKLSNK